MCLEAGRLLDAYVDNELGPAERRTFRPISLPAPRAASSSRTAKRSADWCDTCRTIPRRISSARRFRA